jgi:hypothetical protein
VATPVPVPISRSLPAGLVAARVRNKEPVSRSEAIRKLNASVSCRICFKTAGGFKCSCSFMPVP